ncbi:MAG: DUF1569 domain-containing protein [Bacteroidota bacterium]
MHPEKTTFIRETFPEKLSQLKADTQPDWGIMTPQHMVEHLSGAFAMSRGKFNFPLIIPKEKVPQRQAWLRSDKPFGKSVNGIGLEKGKLIPLRFANLEQAVEKLLAEIPKFYDFMAALDEGATFLHPAFGELSPVDWEQFHYKHMFHHLVQFGLLEAQESL